MPGGAVAQGPSVVGVAGPGYEAGRAHAALLGHGYRDAWTARVEVPVLDLRRFAGGLTPLDQGGGSQTAGLRLRGEDGVRYAFRSVNKSYGHSMPDWARGTVFQWLREDQTAAQHPAAAVMSAVFLDAVGIPHPGPRLVVMPDDPRLGVYRERFAGMLGTIERSTAAGQDGPRPAGSVAVADGDHMLARLDEGPEHRIDGPAFLAERLLSIYLNDWDRHIGQYRFARFDQDGVHRWVPVPEDRDYAFVHHDGLLLGLGRALLVDRLIRFDGAYPDFDAMLWNSQDLVSRLLAGVDRATWDSVANAVGERLTDAAIDRAIAAQPEAWQVGTGDALRSTLRARRDAFPAMAARFYAYLARYPEIRGTDANEVAEVTREPDGAVTVRLRAAGSADPAAPPHFERRFRPEETREIRIFLGRGDDRAVVRGRSGGEPRVRVVGGEGDDTLVDSSGVGLSFYDAQGDNRIEALPGTRVDRRPYAPPASEAILPVPRRDRGTDRRWLYPSAEWVPDVGLRVGAGPRWRRYGFRRDPFAWSHSVVPRIVPGPWRGGVAYVGAYHPESSEAHLALRGDAGNDHVVRFAGIGNDPSDVPGDLARTWYRRYEAAAEWVTPLPDLVAPGLTVAIGSLVRYTDPEPEPGSPLATLRPLGVDGLGEVGVRGRATLDTRDDAGFPRRGYRVEADLTALAPFDRDADPYGLLAAEASGYRPVRVGVPAILAGRVGAEGLLGDAPVWEIPEVGGRNTLRGWSHGRLKGGVALYGTLELRVPLLPARILANGTVGLSGFVDAGRVWDDGRSPGGWRRAAGAGAWFSTEVGSVALEWARGDVHSLYMRLGLGL